MAYYGALASVVQLLEDIILHDRYPSLPLSKHPTIKSLHEKFTFLENLLHGYSSKGDEVTDGVEGRIRDVAYRAQDIIESEISNQIKFAKDMIKSQISNMIKFGEGMRVKKTNQTTSGEKSLVIEGFQYYKIPAEYLRVPEQEVSANVQEMAACQIYAEDTLKKIYFPKVFDCMYAWFPQGISKNHAEDLRVLEQEVAANVQEVVAIKEMQRNESLVLNDFPASTGTLERAPIGGDTMVGFHEYLNTIKDQLCPKSPDQLRVISIIGAGGIGKTTLANYIFDDALVTYRFDKYRAWITVSQDYNEVKALEGISRSLGIFKDEYIEEEMKEHIYKYLKGRRYLIVIDDIWSPEVWDALRRILPNDLNGSRVVLTTRLSDVAQHASGSGLVHKIEYLNEEESWNLFQKKIFAPDDCPLELEAIGKSITRKCGGLPLAIVVLAGVLSYVKRTPHDWKMVDRSASTILSKSDEPAVSSIFSLSYRHLSHQLKPCFLYMGSFPEDHEIKISDLIKLWVAEGFLRSVDRSKSLEHVAEECLEDLVKRNLVIVTKKKSNGQFKNCMLHDLLRDFCRQRAFHEHFFHVEQEGGNLYPREVRNVRQVNLYCSLAHERHPCNMGTLLRTVRRYGRTYCPSFDVIQSDDQKLLRVLDAPGKATWSISGRNPKSIIWEKPGKYSLTVPDIGIFERFHLRYLRLDMAQFTALPISPSIAMLHNLQSLILRRPVHDAIEFPPQIWKMAQLRHIIIHFLTLPLIRMNGNNPVQKLHYLQTLMSVANFRVTNVAIEMIPNLRKLKMWYTVRSFDVWEEYCLYNLIHLPHLEKLSICLTSNSNPNTRNFALPQNLRKLSLEGCELPWKFVTVVGSLPNLQVLKLREDAFVGDEWEPTEGEFSCLKYLLLDYLNLKYWQAEKSHFPCLEHLQIRGCSSLEEIPSDIGYIPTLKFIDVTGYIKSDASAIRIQEEQQDEGNEQLQVRVGKGPHWRDSKGDFGIQYADS